MSLEHLLRRRHSHGGVLWRELKAITAAALTVFTRTIFLLIYISPIMALLYDQSIYGHARGAGTTFGSNDVQLSPTATSGLSNGSATAAGHRDHPKDDADNRDVIMPNLRIGPQNEDLEGEKMAPPGNGNVMAAQLNKSNAGWGQEISLTKELERQKTEQREAREKVRNERMSGTNVDGGAGWRGLDDGTDAA